MHGVLSLLKMIKTHYLLTDLSILPLSINLSLLLAMGETLMWHPPTYAFELLIINVEGIWDQSSVDLLDSP
jgi:hypothetical protein